ncbi:MAG: efflux RND transporter periplasmic adaptor subunit [Propionibacteriales bacterium]|nr:efflux RND transporter periplasmic adaptor subunit [Propionibacteriales bacterium]
MRWHSLVVGGAVCVLAGAGGAAAVVDTNGAGAANTPSTAVETTDKVRRGDLVESTSTSGSLEYAETRDLAAGLSGTLTWLPRAEKVIEEGQRLYRVDDQPVVRLDGAMPAWRDLGPDVTDGADVRQLEEALLRLGYGDEYDMAADGDWTWVTTEAVEDWQEDRGLDRTGTLPLGTVVFTDGDLRIDSQLLDIGDRVPAGSAVLDVSDVARRVTVSLEATQRHLAPVGGKVELDFPDGSKARGRIVDVEVVPAADDQSDDKLSVTVEPLGKKSRSTIGKQLDGASVQVSFTDTLAEDVLIVPVTALVALEDGGYAVEVADGDDTRVVPVETEGFGDTSVAVSGDLHAGDQVVVTP